MMDVVRYTKGGNNVEVKLDGYLNFHYLTHPPETEVKRLLLEAGINRIAAITAADGERRSAILLRSSPWKAGHDRASRGDTRKPGAPGRVGTSWESESSRPREGAADPALSGCPRAGSHRSNASKGAS